MFIAVSMCYALCYVLCDTLAVYNNLRYSVVADCIMLP